LLLLANAVFIDKRILVTIDATLHIIYWDGQTPMHYDIIITIRTR